MGIKYPRPKFSAGLALAGSARTPTGAGLRRQLQLKKDSARSSTGDGLCPQLQPLGGLRPDSYGSRASPPTSTAKRTPPGLLREPDSAADFNCKADSAQTPTRAGLHHRLQLQSRLRPDSYGSRAPSPTSTAGKLRPDSYGSRTSPLTLIT